MASETSASVDRPDPKRPPRPPLPSARRLGTFGMLLFLASLTMLFLATMLGYILIRFQLTEAVGDRQALPLGWLELPTGLWLSTLVIVASSITLHQAGRAVAIERQRPFRRWMMLTAVLAGLFLLVQVPSLYALLAEHRQVQETGIGLYGFVFFLIIVHGAHVIGGIGPLGYITFRAFRGAYDHEHYLPVQHLAMYWHFLDVVWLVMFTMFLSLG